MSTSQLIADLEAMALADVNEIMTVCVVNCRHCWGKGGAYQWRDAAELCQALDAAMRSKGAIPIPSPAGVFGFNGAREPNPDCSRCDGVGVNVVRLADTANVSPGARKLYRGVELYESGQVKRVLLNDPLAARMELHRVRGLHIDRSLNLNANVDLKPATRDEAMALLAKLAPVQP